MRRRLLLLLMAPAGTLAAHGLAYGPLSGGHHDNEGLHGYLPIVAVVASSVAVAGLLWTTVFRRGRALELPSVRSLVLAQLGVFAVQEIVERLAARVSIGDLVSHPAVRCGLATQVLTAAALLMVTRVLRQVVCALLATARRWDISLAFPSASVWVVVPRRVLAEAVWSPPTRGPPLVAG